MKLRRDREYTATEVAEFLDFDLNNMTRTILPMLARGEFPNAVKYPFGGRWRIPGSDVIAYIRRWRSVRGRRGLKSGARNADRTAAPKRGGKGLVVYDDNAIVQSLRRIGGVAGAEGD